MTWLSRLLPQSPRLPRLADHNHRTRQGQRRRRMATLETLEDRTLLSGNVTATLAPTTGILTIMGDTGNNKITIEPSPIAGDIRVIGNVVANPPDATTVNTRTYTDFVASSITSINITMLNGVTQPGVPPVQPNHSITIIGGAPLSTLPGNLTITGGTANDTIQISNFTTDGSVVISESSIATTSDKVTLTNVNTGLEKITTGIGSDTLNLNGGKVGTMTLNTGGAPATTRSPSTTSRTWAPSRGSACFRSPPRATGITC